MEETENRCYIALSGMSSERRRGLFGRAPTPTSLLEWIPVAKLSPSIGELKVCRNGSI